MSSGGGVWCHFDLSEWWLKTLEEGEKALERPGERPEAGRVFRGSKRVDLGEELEGVHCYAQWSMRPGQKFHVDRARRIRDVGLLLSARGYLRLVVVHFEGAWRLSEAEIGSPGCKGIGIGGLQRFCYPDDRLERLWTGKEEEPLVYDFEIGSRSEIGFVLSTKELDGVQKLQRLRRLGAEGFRLGIYEVGGELGGEVGGEEEEASTTTLESIGIGLCGASSLTPSQCSLLQGGAGGASGRLPSLLSLTRRGGDDLFVTQTLGSSIMSQKGTVVRW